MLNLALPMLLTIFVLVSPSNAQEAEAPLYRDGDWWRVKVDIKRPPGVSISGRAPESFPEYIVQFEASSTIIRGVRGNESKQTDAPLVLAMVLGRSASRQDMLKFPMRVGLTWLGHVNFQPPGLPMRRTEAQYEVEAWDKVKTVKGDFDAFRILMNMNVAKGVKRQGATEFRTHTYYYAPTVKAIISYQELGTDISVSSTLVDFSFTQ
jgi:hypothetical protein